MFVELPVVLDDLSVEYASFNPTLVSAVLWHPNDPNRSRLLLADGLEYVLNRTREQVRNALNRGLTDAA
jgi:hypothetical protein